MSSLPLAPQRLLTRIVNAPGRPFASWLAGLLGRPDFPAPAELARLRPATRFLIIALSAWIGLAGLATVLAVAAVEMSAMRLPAWLDARASASTRTEMRPAAAFENILQRPLFSRSRQAAAAPVEVSPPPPAPPVTLDPGITLKGVFINGALAKAFLISAQNPLGVWAQVDEEIAGWRIVAIKPDQVLLDGQNEKLEISLNVSGVAK